jgi:hypothetical protein
MKRLAMPVLSIVLVFVLLLASFGIAKAAAGDDPIVIPGSGDVEFTTEVISIAALPGVTELAGGMLAPAGFPSGEAQFGGNGIQVSGLDHGNATACFTLSTVAVNQGWGGKVGMWNGSKWELLATTISTPEDSPSSLACATISGNGTYAFIKYVTNPDLLPVGKPVCKFSVGALISYYGDDPNVYIGITSPNTYPASGTPFTWSVVSSSPEGLLMGPTSGSAIIGDWDVFDMFFTLRIGPYFSSLGSSPDISLRVDFSECYAIVVFGDSQ